MRTKSSKKKPTVNKDEESENWCFVCKDGGELRICDYRDCLKSYHPECIGKDDSFLESEKQWACARHTCRHCCRPSRLQCYTCSNALCRRCYRHNSDFLPVKGKNGFCDICLSLVLLIEANKDYDSDGIQVDFKDRETVEGLFMEYYVIIKGEEGFEADDIYAAQDRRKKKSNSESDSGDFEEELQSNDDDDDDDSEEVVAEDEEKKYGIKRKKRNEKEKGSTGITYAIKTAMPTKIEFIGWCSKPLKEFLKAIGMDASRKLSQNEVTSIVNQYVKEKSLFHPEKKKVIACDGLLQSLFRRKTIGKYRVYDLLEIHFSENEYESEVEELKSSSEEGKEEDDDDENGSSKKSKNQLEDTKKKSQQKAAKNNVLRTCFASICVENMKLVYLRRSVLRELLKNPEEAVEEKVIGSYARAKSNIPSRNSHRLARITGVKILSTNENNGESSVLLSDTPKEVRISLLSDEDFSEEECDELKRKMKSGELERPTVDDLQRKAAILHRDITNNWIIKQLALLENLIDRANEKGWRRELFEYLERRKKLQNPTEILKLLDNIPTVIPEDDNPDSDSDDVFMYLKKPK